MTLHPLTSKGGAFVLKLGFVFKRKHRQLAVFSCASGRFEPLTSIKSCLIFIDTIVTLERI